MTKKCVALGLAPSFGFGDRTGLATPGHVASMKRCGDGIEAIFPQQSIREMTRTQRTPQQVMDDAMNGAANAGWEGHRTDADHLKVPEDVDITAAVGFTFFTIDPSDDVDQKTMLHEATLRTNFEANRSEAPWFEDYLGKSIKLSTGTVVSLDEQPASSSQVRESNHASIETRRLHQVGQ